MKKKFWTSDKLVALTALIISLLSLYIFIRQTNIIEEQSHLSVMPYLLFESSNDGENQKFSISLVNYGVGPAIITERKLFYKGKTYDMEVVDFMGEVFPQFDTLNVMNNSTAQPGLAIPVGGERNLLTVGGNPEDYQEMLKLMQELFDNNLDYRVEYKSIYNDRWYLDAKTNGPNSIEK